jgi:hypothetical protein
MVGTMKKEKRTKLVLSAQTVRALKAPELGQVDGGVTTVLSLRGWGCVGTLFCTDNSGGVCV